MRVKLPRLLNSEMKKAALLHPNEESIDFHLHSPHQATMLLNESDPDIKLHDFVRLFTVNGDAGVFRVVDRNHIPGDGLQLTMRHSICILAQDKPIIEQESLSGKMHSVLLDLWFAQGVSEAPKYWNFTWDDDNDPDVNYQPNGENLLQAVYSVLKSAGNYALSFFQDEGAQWFFKPVKLSDEPTCEGRFSRNLENVSIREDDYDLVTRVFIDGRVGYYDADTINTWGVFTDTLTIDQAVTDESAQAYAMDYLNAHKNPRMTIELDAVELSNITGESLDRFEIGAICRACLPNYGITMRERIVSLRYPDVYGEPEKLIISMNNEVETTPNLLVYNEREAVSAGRRAGGAAAKADQAYQGLYAVDTKLIEYQQQNALQFDQLTLTLDAVKGELEAKASQDIVSEQGELLSSLSTSLLLKADRSALTSLDQMVTARFDEQGRLIEGYGTQIATNRNEIALRALRSDVATEFAVRDKLIEAKADLILLDGYVKAAQLETTNARISNLTSGLTKATVLDAALIKGDQVQTPIVSTSLLRLGDNNMQIRTVSMGEVASVRTLVTGATSDISLQHSHAVTENDDGTITLGEVSSSGGSFKIANTKAYKEGVLAAQNSVTLSTAGWVGPYGTNTVVASNGKSLIVDLPPFAVTGGDVWSSEHKTTIMFTTPSVNQPVKQVIVDASSVYADGYAAGTVEGGVEDYKQGYEDGRAAWNPASLEKTSYNAVAKTVSVRALNAKDVPLIWEDIDASEIYDAGAEKVYLSSTGWILGENVVNASNGKSLIVQLPNFSAEVGVWNSQNKAIVNFYTPSVSVPISQREVDGNEVYNRGKDSVSLSSDGWINGVNTVEASNGKTFDVQLPAVTLRGGEYWDVENHTTNVFASVPGVNAPIAELLLDASIIYDLGKAEVSLSAAEWQNGIKKITASNGTSLIVELPAFSSSEGSWAGTKKMVFFSTPSVNVPLLAVEVDAETVYENGRASVNLSSAGWIDGVNTVTASNGKIQRVELPEFSASEGNWSGNKKSVYFSTPSVSVPLQIVEIDASGIYQNGRASVNLSSAGWIDGVNTVTASNGKTQRVELPEFQVSGGTTWANKKTTVYFSTQSVNQPLKSIQVDATSVYNEGYEAGYEAAKSETVVYGSIEEIRNTAPNTFYARGYARALVGGEQVDSTTFYKTQTIKVGQS